LETCAVFAPLMCKAGDYASDYGVGSCDDRIFFILFERPEKKKR